MNLGSENIVPEPRSKLSNIWSASGSPIVATSNDSPKLCSVLESVGFPIKVDTPFCCWSLSIQIECLLNKLCILSFFDDSMLLLHPYE